MISDIALQNNHDRSRVAAYVSVRRAAGPFRVIEVGGFLPMQGIRADAIVDCQDPKIDGAVFFKGDISQPDVWDQVSTHTRKYGLFDFCLCSHTIEDIANPKLACDRMQKIAKAGYIAVPSRHVEFCRFEGQYRGYYHHRWIFTLTKDKEFIAFPKLGLLDYENQFDVLQDGGLIDFSFFWRDTIDLRIINGDFLGPSRSEMLKYYNHGLTSDYFSIPGIDSISRDDGLLVELEREYENHSLGKLGYWQQWQNSVKDKLPLFAGEYVYLSQHYENTEYGRVASWLSKRTGFSLSHKHRTTDCQYGAQAVGTALGQATRAWLESQVELEFIQRFVRLDGSVVLDIGAGYGRLAVAISEAEPLADVYCVDAVPISTYLQLKYTKTHAPNVCVKTLTGFDSSMPIDLAINVHSWSECRSEQVEMWVDRLNAKYLFTVSNTPGYETWGDHKCDGRSFKPIVDTKYELLHEEIGLGVDKNSTYAMWRLRV